MNDLRDIETPALLLDRGRLEANCRKMRERLVVQGVALRPHMKTAKCAQIATIALGADRGAVTVSTLREARGLLEAGFDDILYAVGITAARIDAIQQLAQRGAQMTVITDNAAVARAIRDHLPDGPAFRVLIEIDCGGGRAGVLPDSPELIEIARLLQQSTAAKLGGVMTHAGHAYHCRDIAAVAAVARQESDALLLAARRLRESGLPCAVLSGGSTPTAVHARSLEGVTEMRPGVYMFYDLDQVELGSCGRDDLALSVLASVIGHNHHTGHLLIDAGALALSKDLSATEFRPRIGYGEVCDATTLQHLPDLFVDQVHQEHGIVPVTNHDWFQRLPVGARVRILPNHACMTAAAYADYTVLQSGEPVDRWPRINGW